jgi:hypothetical protein
MVVQNDLCICHNGIVDSVVWRNLLFDVKSSENDSRFQLVVGVGVGTMRTLSFEVISEKLQFLDEEIMVRAVASA